MLCFEILHTYLSLVYFILHKKISDVYMSWIYRAFMPTIFTHMYVNFIILVYNIVTHLVYLQLKEIHEPIVVWNVLTFHYQLWLFGTFTIQFFLVFQCTIHHTNCIHLPLWLLVYIFVACAACTHVSKCLRLSAPITLTSSILQLRKCNIHFSFFL